MKEVIYNRVVFHMLVEDYVKYTQLVPMESRLTFHEWAFEIQKQ